MSEVIAADEPGTHSLAGASPGERVTVVRILFDEVRARCAQLGVSEGSPVRLEARNALGVRLTTSAGSLVPCEPALARFVEVARVEP